MHRKHLAESSFFLITYFHFHFAPGLNVSTFQLCNELWIHNCVLPFDFKILDFCRIHVFFRVNDTRSVWIFSRWSLCLKVWPGEMTSLNKSSLMSSPNWGVSLFTIRGRYQDPWTPTAAPETTNWGQHKLRWTGTFSSTWQALASCRSLRMMNNQGANARVATFRQETRTVQTP